MSHVKRIHPSATVFVAVLIALFLPFGHAVSSCEAEGAEFTGIELIVGGVDAAPATPGEPITAADREFADRVETDTMLPAAVLLAAAASGLLLAVFLRGRLWGTCCTLIALAALAIALLANVDDAHAGWHIAFWLPAGGVLARVLVAVRRGTGEPSPDANAPSESSAHARDSGLASTPWP